MATASAAAQAVSFDQTQYKERARKLVALVNQLRDAGAQFSLDLPCMVVCGNQSAGKSSLLERLCGVRLPRAAGTCTKCPTEVRLSTAPPGGTDVTWCCQIKLRKEYGKDNKQLVPKPKEQAFKTLTQVDKDQLHCYISAAQRALLNPDTPADIFAREADTAASLARSSSSSRGGGGNDRGFSDGAAAIAGTASAAGKEDSLKFTRNVIVLEITGADVDLALIDLPGIIQTEQGDDGSNVELVQDLVKQYISSDRAIIVATITCKDDIDNQQIVQMARAADSKGGRTIGVLTKADTIEPGTHHTWLPVLQGATYPLSLGYFCVVNPSQEDLNKNISPAEAAAKEVDFFKRDAFFSSELVAAVKHRFGVDALRVQLSKQLVALTQRELPQMKLALEEVMEQVEQQLHKLPPPPASDPSLELFRRLRDLAAAVRQAVEGTDDADFFRAADSCYRSFRKAVLAARPTVRLTEAAQRNDASSSTSNNSRSSSSGDAAGEESPHFWLDGPKQDSEEGEVGSDSEPMGLITLDKVREVAGKYRVKELPTFAPYRVLEELVQGLKGCWDKAALCCLHDVAEALQALAVRLVDEQFGQFALARKEIRSRLYEKHAVLLEETEQRVREVMAMEREHIWTQNDHYFSDSKERFEAMLMGQLYGSGRSASQAGASRMCSNNRSVKDNLDAALASLAAAGIQLTAEDLDVAHARKKQKTAYEDEGLLGLIAGTLAYFKVSSKRVIDAVPMHLRHYLLLRFCKQLEDLPVELAAALPGNNTATAGDELAEVQQRSSDAVRGAGDGQAQQQRGDAKQAVAIDPAQLMAEDESVAQRRAQLKRQLAQLQGVRKILSVF